jgi:cytochrome c-type biogenesis protein CcmH/NrfF
MKRLAQLTFVALLVFGTLGSNSSQQRFEKLGHRLMCSCGCNQVLLECNHVGCPASDGMRNELTAGIDKSSNDDAVLDSFVQKYGPIVLAAPTMTGFNRVAWLAPYVAFALGLGLVVFIVRNWRHKLPAVSTVTTPADPALQDYRRRAHEETQL